jgi:antitoxin (DNA-binding transcriptional repressor) of toxin-antitoxin stability system
MATIHISGADAARDFAGLIAKVRAGAEIVIDDGFFPPAILRAAAPARRSISECIELARKHEPETSEVPVLDPDFAGDVADIVRNRKPWKPAAWD